MSNNIAPLVFNGISIRVVEDQDELWFSAKDIDSVLSDNGSTEYVRAKHKITIDGEVYLGEYGAHAYAVMARTALYSGSARVISLLRTVADKCWRHYANFVYDGDAKP